ncbi:lysophospholipid acyltransferase 5-like [Littorina saxatilis]|uniref:Lysophospholipid acyltransferase 5 n=1 Tax=Littorina saxatilis TaxID=31220 RepID=A0AAN9G493_9CAEN
MSGSFIAPLATVLGASESGTRLLLSLLSGYPLALLYRSSLLYNQPPAVKHVYFIMTGLLQCWFNFGTDVYHSMFNITFIYILLRVAGGTKFSAVFAFFFNLTYLVVGYYYEVVSGKEYNISWTMPHCVLTLRLTAVAFDLYDGHKTPIPPAYKETALTKAPSLLELFGQCYFFGGFLVGPQYSMRRYMNFVNGEYSDPKTKGPPNTVMPALERFLLGIAYIGAYQAVYIFVSDEFLQSEAFQERGLLLKCVLLIIWGKTCLHKYIGSWLLTEGAIIFCGLSYNNLDENKQPLWDGCTNVRVKLLETGCTLQHAIRSFNCNTNLWMAQYIFKRLRFLGNKLVSQAVTLFYLAIWHGQDTGYFINFFLEFIYTMCERQIASTVERIGPLRQFFGIPALQPVLFVVKKIYSTFLLSFALVGFSLLQYSKWNGVYASLHYVGFVIPALLLSACTFLQFMFPSKSEHNGVTSSSPSKSQTSQKSD